MEVMGKYLIFQEPTRITEVEVAVVVEGVTV
jgi:hypothetical protein